MAGIRAVIKRTLTQNVLWATVCVGLICILSGLIATNISLQQQTDQLQQQLTADAKSDCTARDAWKAGTSKTLTVESDNLNRMYIVHLPKDFRTDKSYPLILYFNGKKRNAADGDLHSGYNQLPAIIAYPQSTIGKDGVLSWESAPYSSGVDDVRFVGRMLDQIEGQLCIERPHVYAVGMSNGGGLTALLACQIPDRITAFGMVAGALYYPTSICKPKKPAPIIAIHGDSDTVVPFTGSALRKLPDIDQWAAGRAKLNGCDKTPLVAHQEASTINTWSDCTDNATVKFIHQHGVGHVWTVNDRDVIWKFLSNY